MNTLKDLTDIELVVLKQKWVAMMNTLKIPKGSHIEGMDIFMRRVLSDVPDVSLIQEYMFTNSLDTPVTDTVVIKDKLVKVEPVHIKEVVETIPLKKKDMPTKVAYLTDNEIARATELIKLSKTHPLRSIVQVHVENINNSESKVMFGFRWKDDKTGIIAPSKGFKILDFNEFL